MHPDNLTKRKTKREVKLENNKLCSNFLLSLSSQMLQAATGQPPIDVDIVVNVD